MKKITIANAPVYTSPNSMTLICTEKPDGTTFYSYRAIYTPLFYFALLGGWLIIAAHYWASFKLFCRVQVINNKWLNV